MQGFLEFGSACWARASDPMINSLIGRGFTYHKTPQNTCIINNIRRGALCLVECRKAGLGTYLVTQKCRVLFAAGYFILQATLHVFKLT